MGWAVIGEIVQRSPLREAQVDLQAYQLDLRLIPPEHGAPEGLCGY